MAAARIRKQAILDARSSKVVAVEVLCPRPMALPLGDTEAMCANDIAMAEYALLLAEAIKLPVHFNVEPETLMLAGDKILQYAKHGGPLIVLEVVERLSLLSHPGAIEWLDHAIAEIRSVGALIAMDDVTPTDRERELIRRFRPDIIKVEDPGAIPVVREISGATGSARIVVERIETRESAELCRLYGADMLQGFWCDNAGYPQIVDLHPAFSDTPPRLGGLAIGVRGQRDAKTAA